MTIASCSTYVNGIPTEPTVICFEQK